MYIFNKTIKYVLVTVDQDLSIEKHFADLPDMAYVITSYSDFAVVCQTMARRIFAVNVSDDDAEHCAFIYAMTGLIGYLGNELKRHTKTGIPRIGA